jgi:hypothetical protein
MDPSERSPPTKEQQKCFTRAVQSFIEDTKKHADVKSPFYREVLSQLSNIYAGNLTAEDCANGLSTFINDLEAAQRSGSRTMQVSERLRPFIDGAAQYTAAFDIMIQAGPAAAVILYGGARLVLQVRKHELRHQHRPFHSIFR